MLKAIIIEDEPNNIHLLTRILSEKFDDIQVEAICKTKKEAVGALQSLQVQLIFMDIILPDGNSFDLFEEVPALQAHIIFISAHDEFAIKAIKFSALDYLLKPIDETDLCLAVQKARDKIYKNERNSHQLNVFNLNKEKITRIVLPSSEGHSFVSLSDIYYLQGDGAYTSFFVKGDARIVVSKPLKEYEALLEDEGFFRIHQSYIINLLYVKKYIKGSGGTVILENGIKINVAVRRKEEFLRITHIH